MYARRSFVLLSLFSLCALILLVSLGMWQVNRLHWKEALIAKINLANLEKPDSIENAMERAVRDDVPFLPVQDRVQLITNQPFYLHWINDGKKGVRFIAPVQLENMDIIFADFGFVPDEKISTTALPAVDQIIEVSGRLRTTEKPNLFTPNNDVEGNLWFWRDLRAMGSELGLPSDKLLDRFVALETNTNQAAWPDPIPLPQNISNKHLGYALTWFGLAACLVGVFIAYSLKIRKSKDGRN